MITTIILQAYGPSPLEGSFVLHFYKKDGGAYNCQFGSGDFTISGEVPGVAYSQPNISTEGFTTNVTLNIYDPKH